MESNSATSHNIPGGTLEASTANITVKVGSFNSTTSLGSAAAPGSGFVVINADESDAFSTQ